MSFNVEDTHIIRKQILDFIKNKEITKTAFAKNIGYSRQIITKYLSENSENNIPQSFLTKIETAYELEKDYFTRFIQDRIDSQLEKNAIYDSVPTDLSFEHIRTLIKESAVRAQKAHEAYKTKVLKEAKRHLYSMGYSLKEADGELYAEDRKVRLHVNSSSPQYFALNPYDGDAQKHDYIIENISPDEILVISHVFDDDIKTYVVTDNEVFKGAKDCPVETLNGELYTLDGESLERFKIIDKSEVRKQNK